MISGRKNLLKSHILEENGERSITKMIIKFSVKNFLSFNNEVTISMVPSLQKTKQDQFIKNDTMDLLRFGIIYGANASGKSNIIKALGFIPRILKTKLTYETKDMYCRNNEENINLPSTFIYTFLYDNKIYCYETIILLSKSIIMEENLYQVNIKTGSTKALIVRKYDSESQKNIIDFNSNNITGKSKSRLNTYIEDFIDNKDSLFLQEMSNKKFEENDQLYFISVFNKWFDNILDVNEASLSIHNMIYLKNGQIKDFINILKNFDTGISNIDLIDISNDEFKKRLDDENTYNEFMNDLSEFFSKTKNNIAAIRGMYNFFIFSYKEEKIRIQEFSISHNCVKNTFKYGDESDGTRRLFDLFDILLGPDNKVYIVDEIERSLHPILLYQFFKIFKEKFKEKNIQLIVSTHETHIMTQDLFRRDEIWFVEKDKLSNSNIYSLDIFKERLDKALEPNYLDGRFGAIPIINNFYQE